MTSQQFVTLNAFQLQPQLQQQKQLQQQQSQTNRDRHGRPIIERGASWSYNETRILLSLWGQDMVQRQLTNSKRTRHVWEKIAERIREHGFDRSAEQVRTRVFNMIAEYRRILKDPTPEKKKKCIFFDALHKIYQAKDTKGVRAALNDYEEEYNLDPIDFSQIDDNQDGEGDISDEVPNGIENEEKSEIFSYAMSPSQALPNGMGHGPEDSSLDDIDEGVSNGPTPAKRLRSDSNISSQNYAFQQFDNSSSALLIDRMFAHLAKETEVMRDWVQLERERMNQDVIRRKEDNEREERREKAFLHTLTRMQEQMFSFLSKYASNQPNNSSSAVSSQSSPCNHLPHHDDGLEAAGGHDYN